MEIKFIAGLIGEYLNSQNVLGWLFSFLGVR